MRKICENLADNLDFSGNDGDFRDNLENSVKKLLKNTDAYELIAVLVVYALAFAVFAVIFL